jgi:hypothetical protein
MRPCKHCETNLDGDLIFQTFLDQGNTEKEALATAKMYSGWEQRGLANRWGREIGHYDYVPDRTVYYKCPDCGKKV